MVVNDHDRELEEIKRGKLSKMLKGVRKRGGAKTATGIVVRVLDDSGLDAKLSGHFERPCMHVRASTEITSRKLLQPQ